MSGAAIAQFRGCPVDDYLCLDDVLASRCAERGTSAETCKALVTELQIQQRITPTTAIGETLGLAFYRLADLAFDEGDNDAETAYRAIARQVFLNVVSNDESAGPAYTMLALIDRDSTTDRGATTESMDWARKAVATGANWIVVSGVVRDLLDWGTPEAASEAVEIAVNDYSKAEPGRDKWRSAAIAHETYQTATLRFPATVPPEAVDEFDDRVKQDGNWNSALRVLDDPVARPTAVSDALVAVCNLARIFGDEPCLHGIDATAQAALTYATSPNAQVLADAAAIGMMAAHGPVHMVGQDANRTMLIAWLDRFLDNRLDSLVVLDALATVSIDRDIRRETRIEIVSRDPDSGEARFQLGKVLFDQRRWAEAVPQLEKARELSPPEDQIRIRSYLRQAEYEAGNLN